MGGFSLVAKIFYPIDVHPPRSSIIFIPILILLPFLFAVSLFARYETRRYWRQIINRKEEEKLRRISSALFRIALICILYPLVFPYTPVVVFFFITVFGIFTAFVKKFSLLGAFIILLCVTVLVFSVSRLKGKNKIKRFKRELTQIAESEGYELTIFNKEMERKLGYDLTLRKGDDVYSCKIIRAKKSTPLYFISEKSAYFLHRMGTNHHHLSIERHFDYGFEAEGVKCLILIRYPKKVFVCSHNAARGLVGGDRIWEYIVYDAPSFLGAADRKCLERYNDYMRN